MNDADPPQRTGRTDIAAGLVLVALSLTALLWLIPQHTEAVASGFDIAPGLFPNLAAGVVLLLALAHTAQQLWRRKPVARDPSAPTGGRILAELAIWAFVAIAALAGLTRIGFVATAALVIALGMVAAGARSWLLIGAVTVAVPLVIDWTAWTVFTVDLP